MPKQRSKEQQRQAELAERHSKLNKLIDHKEHLQYRALMLLQDMYSTLPMDELLRLGSKRELIDSDVDERFGTAAVESLLAEWRQTVDEMMRAVIEVNRPDTR